MDAEPADDSIEITLPARTEFAATLRVICASLGADLGFTVDEIDDLRLALNEIFTSAAESEGSRRVELTLRPTGTTIEVTARYEGSDPIELDPLAGTILRSVVDVDEARADVIRFSKRATEAAR